MKVLGVLDRFVIRQWLMTFLLSALGVPAVGVLIDLSERFGKMSSANVPLRDIFLGQLYLFPSKMALMLPAAVLFATVFTLNSMGRNSELTAAKAGSISIYRLIAPIFFLATVAVPADFGLQEVASVSTTRQRELQRERVNSNDAFRAFFAYTSPSGWAWAVKEMRRAPGGHSGTLNEALLLAPVASDSTHWSIRADSGRYAGGLWQLQHGMLTARQPGHPLLAITFRSLRARDLTDPPSALMDEQRKAEEMTLAQLKQHVAQLTASGARVGILRVEIPFKYALPVACLVVAIFGAPLALSTPRSGAAIGLAIALGTTLVYLTGIQIMKQVGGKEMISPMAAAWSMNAVFLVVGAGLMSRVKS